MHIFPFARCLGVISSGAAANPGVLVIPLSHPDFLAIAVVTSKPVCGYSRAWLRLLAFMARLIGTAACSEGGSPWLCQAAACSV